MKLLQHSLLLVLASINVIHAAADGCTLTGTYSGPTSLSTCDVVTVSSLKVSAGVTLDLSSVKSGATIKFEGTTTFAPKIWGGPLVLLTGSNLNVTGSGTLDGQGSWYWKQGDQIKRPVFLRVERVVNSVISGFTMKDAPYHNVRFFRSTDTTVTGLTLDSSAGAGLAKNTDGFGLSQSDRITITGNTVMNQDDCLAMQSSTNSVFSNNICKGSRGWSIGSIGGTAVDQSSTVTGLVVSGNTMIDGENGIRIKAIVGLKGLVQNVTFSDNKLQNVKRAIVVHSDYSNGDYTGTASSQVKIQNFKINGLSGTAKYLYDVNVNPSVVSDWSFSGITVSATLKSTCKGQPSVVSCA